MTLSMIWNNLVRWVQEVDGSSTIHKSLTLRTTKDHHRGLFASEIIHSGDILLRLPLKASINGEMMPSTYEHADICNAKGESVRTTKSLRNVSPWLRCLAALMKELRLRDGGQPQQSSHYLDSLPHDYETLWKWSNREIEEYLAGTRPPNGVYDQATSNHSSDNVKLSSTSNQWMIVNDPKLIRRQYETRIHPYLIHCGILSAPPSTCGSFIDDDDETRKEKVFQLFQRACQIMSTRSFYNVNDNQNDDTPTSENKTTTYDGPYLLPIVDLINHADTCTGCTNTKLEFIAQPNLSGSSYYFIMRALRTIPPNTEILHSYGDALSNSQFLSSFGCIPINRMIDDTQHQQQQILCDQQLGEYTSNNQSAPTSATATTNSRYTKSVSITKQEIWDACWDIIEYGSPQKLATSMIESEEFDPDEIWKVSIDKSRTAECVPESIMIVQPPFGLTAPSKVIFTSNDDDDDEKNYDTTDSSSILSDELVTTACIPFLPKCAYAEITSRTLLDVSILQDYYLGHLVSTALLQAIERRLSLYRPISTSTIRRLLLCDTVMNDKELLHSLLRCIETTGNNGNCDASQADCGKSDIIDGNDLNVERWRLTYGLTIRLEEKEILQALASTILLLKRTLNQTVDNVNFNNSDDDIQFEKNDSTKRCKTNDV